MSYQNDHPTPWRWESLQSGLGVSGVETKTGRVLDANGRTVDVPVSKRFAELVLPAVNALGKAEAEKS